MKFRFTPFIVGNLLAAALMLAATPPPEPKLSADQQVEYMKAELALSDLAQKYAAGKLAAAEAQLAALAAQQRLNYLSAKYSTPGYHVEIGSDLTPVLVKDSPKEKK